jgi:hypothetical protein
MIGFKSYVPKLPDLQIKAILNILHADGTTLLEFITLVLKSTDCDTCHSADVILQCQMPGTNLLEVKNLLMYLHLQKSLEKSKNHQNQLSLMRAFG